ncbi:hypothetical protein CKO15_06770 [Halorhodospira abdelmalekii]|uniref:outer membrane lipoprotein-sorting protein n=1 Tax=Halorhodospira abdelmalekii TaxID=421629 RepID=UPI001908C9DB|nr:outer membrane lipoprotein-sorting protein [Halorhodospira abdelmalekii]MBK1734990.1 hypothetical protein [Halorhodospira abdelmalekii]
MPHPDSYRLRSPLFQLGASAVKRTQPLRHEHRPQRMDMRLLSARWLLLTLLLPVAWLTALAATPIAAAEEASVSARERGSALAEAVEQRPRGERRVIHHRMELLEPGRDPRVRELYSFRRSAGSADQTAASLIRFSAPADIAGMGLLTIGEGTANSEQWVYLPARNMTRRIPSGQRGARFAGSDFFYEDLRDRAAEMDDHIWQGTASLNGIETEIVSSIPHDPHSSVYAKRLIWIDPERAIPLRVDYFAPTGGTGSTPADTPFKRYQVLAVEKIEGYWTITETVMEDLESGHQTRLLNLSTRYEETIPDRLFTRRALEDPMVERPFRP